MDTTNSNPLLKHFRQPAIYLKLPSNGKFYPSEAINLTASGEIPIYPMTVKDELILKTPDALMNGDAMARIINSCCPSIIDPWSIPSVDIDAIFVGIRIASYGAGMDVNTKCPHCGEENEHTINLTTLLESIMPVSQNSGAVIDSMIFEFRPPTYRDINQVNIKTFEERRLINNIINSDLPEEEKKRAFNESFQKLTEMNLQQVLSNISSITIGDTRVTDPEHIKEFLVNTSRKVYVEIKERAQEMLNNSKVPAVKLNCNGCTKEYETGIEFDQSNFFE